MSLVGSTLSESDLADSPVPSVIERLGQLRPSKELLEYYRKKLSEYDEDQEKLSKKLDRFKVMFDEQNKLLLNLQKREEEIGHLQRGLSDLQTILYQEREQNLRLYSENDRLRIQEVNDRKKIQQLLSLTKHTGNEITYLVKEHPPGALPCQHSQAANNKPRSPPPSPRKLMSFKDRGPGGHHSVSKGRQRRNVTSSHNNEIRKILGDESETMRLKIDALQKQLNEQVRLSNEQIHSLMEDNKLQQQERELETERSSERIDQLTVKLSQTQHLLYESTKDYLDLKYETRLKERKWMNERDKIMQEMDILREQLDIRKEDIETNQGPMVVNAGTQMITSPGGSERRAPIRATNMMVIKELRHNLQQAQNMAELYREQVIGLEDELSRIREEKDVGKDLFKEKTEKLTKRLKLMNQRYESLEKRRMFEVEGFKNDIKILRSRLKDVEKQLYKVSVNIGDQFDWEILHNVHKTAGRSKKLAGELHKLKTKVYGLEHNLKHL